MYAVRLHGRGGQGIVTTAELLAVAVFGEGGHAQAFPTFGSERTGAPVAAYCRIGSVPIRTHEPITHPDALIVADPTLFGQVDVLAGLRPGGLVIVNAADLPEILNGSDAEIHCVSATEIARRHVGRPVPGTALLGAFAALTGRVGLPALLGAIGQRFPASVAAANAAAAQEAYHQLHVREQVDA
jgi:pyruvate ferredoxin oxidoreductase gamma subunit